MFIQSRPSWFLPFQIINNKHSSTPSSRVQFQSITNQKRRSDLDYNFSIMRLKSNCSNFIEIKKKKTWNTSLTYPAWQVRTKEKTDTGPPGPESFPSPICFYWLSISRLHLRCSPGFWYVLRCLCALQHLIPQHLSQGTQRNNSILPLTTIKNTAYINRY